MEEAELAISDYIDNKTASYAILLSGPWGRGKTHFIKNRISKLVESKQHKLIHVSLFGIQTSEELSKELFYATNPVVKKKRRILESGTQVVKIVMNMAALYGKRVGNLKISIEPFLNMKKKSVLCFDDLERCGMPLMEVMGFINSFVEHDGMKVIIVAAEDEVRERESFQRFKEKIIGKTISFISKSDIAVPQIINIYRDINLNLFVFLEKNVRLIVFCLERSGDKSLRSLVHGLSNFADVYNLLAKLGERFISYWGVNLLYFTVAITFEMEKGDLEKNVALNLDQSSIYLGELGSDTKEKQFIKQFKQKYYIDSDQKLIMVQSIIKYCYHGHLDERLFKEEIIIEDSEKYESNKPTSFQVLSHLGYWELEQNEFEFHKNSVLSDIDEGRFDYKQFLNIYSLYKIFFDNGLIEETLDQLQDRFKRGFENSIKDNHELGLKWNEENDFLIELKENIEEVSMKIKKNAQKSKLKGLLNEAPNDMEVLLNLIREQEVDEEEHFFVNVDSEEFIEFICKLSNIQLSRVRNSIVERYNFSNIKEFYLKELPTLIEVQSELESLAQNEESSLRRFNLLRIKSAIENVVARLS